MDDYPSYRHTEELDADDIQTIAELATEHISPDQWTNRDSPSAFQKVAILSSYLEHYPRAEVTVLTEAHDTSLESNEKTLWVRLENAPQKEFDDFDETYYLPTEERLEDTIHGYGDWY
jgi:hypothetical protein